MLKVSRVVSMMALLAFASFALAQNRPVKDYPGSVARGAHPNPLVLTGKETLKVSYADSGAGGAFASCGSAGCLAPTVAIYSENIACPAAAKKTCTFDIQIAGQVESGGNSIADGEDGLYQFLIDGGIPTGGGTDGNGYYAWQFFGPEYTFGTSYNVHSTVTNTAANEVHNITVNLSCFDLLGDPDGCFADSGFQTIVVGVWTP